MRWNSVHFSCSGKSLSTGFLTLYMSQCTFYLKKNCLVFFACMFARCAMHSKYLHMKSQRNVNAPGDIRIVMTLYNTLSAIDGVKWKNLLFMVFLTSICEVYVYSFATAMLSHWVTQTGSQSASYRHHLKHLNLVFLALGCFCFGEFVLWKVMVQ